MRPGLARVLATFFGAGLFPVAPGTAGSWVALPLAAIAALHPAIGLLLVALLVILGVPAATRTARDIGREDPGCVVIDEAAGMTLAAVAITPDWSHLLAAFLLFRLIDVVKPWPCRRLERLSGGWGIMADDLAAGLYVLAILHAGMAWGL